MENNKHLLPQNLHYILIGLMLGDGHIYKTSTTSNSRMEMSFGKDRELFANWIGDLFKDYSKTGIKKITILNRKESVTNNSFNFRFKTKTLPVFNYYHEIFYLCEAGGLGEHRLTSNTGIKYKKVVPQNILNIMNPTVLAYLIMTDGNFDKSRNRVRIYTNSFSKIEVENLAKSIKLNLDIYVGVLHDRKDQ
jgi:hypothetical protein